MNIQLTRDSEVLMVDLAHLRANENETHLQHTSNLAAL